MFSYFEYVGLRKLARAFSVGQRRDRLRTVSPYLSEHIRKYQFEKRHVIRNVPPALARHLRYTG